jgi:hypothetical protein
MSRWTQASQFESQLNHAVNRLTISEHAMVERKHGTLGLNSKYLFNTCRGSREHL